LNLSVALQDETTGATTGGVLYLTNIHRLYGELCAQLYFSATPKDNKGHIFKHVVFEKRTTIFDQILISRKPHTCRPWQSCDEWITLPQTHNIYRRLKVNRKILSPAALNLQAFFTCLSSLQFAINAA
jgi:hypothetical protein